MNYNSLTDAVREIIALLDEYKNDEDSEHKSGHMLGLAEALGVIKTYFVGDEAVEKLLDFDIDKKYLL